MQQRSWPLSLTWVLVYSTASYRVREREKLDILWDQWVSEEWYKWVQHLQLGLRGWVHLASLESGVEKLCSEWPQYNMIIVWAAHMESKAHSDAVSSNTALCCCCCCPGLATWWVGREESTVRRTGPRYCSRGTWFGSEDTIRYRTCQLLVHTVVLLLAGIHYWWVVYTQTPAESLLWMLCTP